MLLFYNELLTTGEMIDKYLNTSNVTVLQQAGAQRHTQQGI